MIEIEIPGFRVLQLSHLVLDYNGTQAVNGDPIEGVKSRLDELAGSLDIHDVFSALKLLRNPRRLVATLRS